MTASREPCESLGFAWHEVKGMAAVNALDAWRMDKVPESDAICPEEIPVSASFSNWMRTEEEHNAFLKKDGKLWKY